MRAATARIVLVPVKGGTYIGKEVDNPIVKDALLDYLRSAKRLEVFRIDGPLWTRHDKTGLSGAALSSHSYVKNLKRYAKEAGIGKFHMHQTRHTFARIVVEETGSIIETQDALNHRNPSTTRIYVQRIAVKKDRHSRLIVRICKYRDYKNINSEKGVKA
jgi:integrase